LTGAFVAEVGVGVVHRSHPVERAAPDPSTVGLHRRIKDLFDPTGRLNPGRSVFA
jgi:FAD/FMN-containing dehydrogenase